MIGNALYTSISDDWETPLYLYEKLDDQYHFELDPCASDINHKCSRYYTKKQDGLNQSWENYRVFCNPPYGRQIGRWVEKCAEHGKNHLAVMLIPARTDTQWFHKYIYNKPNVQIIFLKGRIRFSNATENAPFPSMIVIFDGRDIKIKTAELLDRALQALVDTEYSTPCEVDDVEFCANFCRDFVGPLKECWLHYLEMKK